MCAWTLNKIAKLLHILRYLVQVINLYPILAIEQDFILKLYLGLHILLYTVCLMKQVLGTFIIIFGGKTDQGRLTVLLQIAPQKYTLFFILWSPKSVWLKEVIKGHIKAVIINLPRHLNFGYLLKGEISVSRLQVAVWSVRFMQCSD